MKIDRFDDGFDETDDWGERWASAETGADPEPELEPEPEPDFGSGDAPEPEPDYGPEDWDDREPEPAADELWPRTVESVKEPPAVAAPPAPQAPSEPLGDSEKADLCLGPVRQPKTKAPFIMGPLCREWIVRALSLGNPAIAVGLGLYHRAGFEKDDFIRGRRTESLPMRVDRRLKQQFCITPSQCSRGISALKAAGLIRVVKGGAGRCPVVAIVNIQPKRNGDSTNP
jgi:hypothetical protein